MKKLLVLLICVGLLGMSACSKDTTITKSDDDSNTTAAETTSLDESKETLGMDSISDFADIDVDEGLLSVTVTIPADLVDEGTTQETVDSTVKEKGYLSGTLNDDGTVTYVMTKAQHSQAMKELTEGFDKTLQDIVDSEDYPNIISITHNDDFTDFKIGYAAEEVGLVDAFSVIVYYYVGGLYGVFNGNRPDNIHVSFVNSETGEIISESNSSSLGSGTEE